MANNDQKVRSAFRLAADEHFTVEQNSDVADIIIRIYRNGESAPRDTVLMNMPDFCHLTGIPMPERE